MLPALKLNKFPEKENENRALEKLEMLCIAQLASKKSNKISEGKNSA